MADRITTYALDTNKIDVVANSPCRRVSVKEDYDSDTPPTANLLQYDPTGSSTPAKVVKGTPAVFTKSKPSSGVSQEANTYFPGEVVGGIATSSGSITVQQIESDQI
ncbi:hypothetical protein LCGC14_0466760 [marine sediment metagenome]|uniref:Uncharacterized protein n=1 Tax=marine sediment metagenome TaxID=412755 RepID=A0A0F9V091_9ZZZZ